MILLIIIKKKPNKFGTKKKYKITFNIEIIDFRLNLIDVTDRCHYCGRGLFLSSTKKHIEDDSLN